jgi:hypothetical protein
MHFFTGLHCRNFALQLTTRKMEKIKFAGQVLFYVTVIPALFIGTLVGQEARLRERIKQAQYCLDKDTKRTYAAKDPRVARIVMSCRPPMIVKK